MSKSEIGFLIGLFGIVVFSYVTKYIFIALFTATLSPEDKDNIAKALNSGRQLKEGEIAQHSVILACIVSFMGLSLYVNSAILVALLIKGFIW